MSDEAIEPFTLRKRDECLFCGISYKEFISQSEKIKELQEAMRGADKVINRLVTSEALKEAPFYNYSEAILLGHDWLQRYGLEKEIK